MQRPAPMHTKAAQAVDDVISSLPGHVSQNKVTWRPHRGVADHRKAAHGAVPFQERQDILCVRG
jgi:hypothetical protein